MDINFPSLKKSIYLFFDKKYICDFVYKKYIFAERTYEKILFT